MKDISTSKTPRFRMVAWLIGAALLLTGGLAQPQQPAEPGKDKGSIKALEQKIQELVDELRKKNEELIKKTEEVARLKEDIANLKKPPLRQLPGVCKMTADLEENVVALRAEFKFYTQNPNMIVPLGFKDAFLASDGDFDRQNLALKFDEDGFYLEVAKPGTYDKVVLNLKVPVSLRGSGGERKFKVNLPGAGATSMSLGMPTSVKEIRWNETNSEKTREKGRWELIGLKKSLEVSWKEAPIFPAGAALVQAVGNITVKLEEMNSLITAELRLEDPAGQTKEWHLFLPANAEPKVGEQPLLEKPTIIAPPPDSKNQPYIIRFTQPQPAFTVKVEQRTARSTNSLLVGPFFVQNAYLQQGTITVLAAPAAVRGQWLDFHPYGEVHRDVAKGQDVKAVFNYWNLGKGPSVKGQDARIPLKIEWRAVKGSVQTQVEQQIKLRSDAHGLQVTTLTHITVKTLSAGVDFLDVQLPRPHPPRLGLLHVFAAAPFPASLPWAGLVEMRHGDLGQAAPPAYPVKFALDEENDSGGIATLSAPDAQGKAQIKFPLGNKEFKVTLVGQYYVSSKRFRIELPRPLGILDKGGTVSVSSDDPRIELLVGPANAEEPVPPKVELKTEWDSSSPFLDLAWRKFEPQFQAQNVTDVKFHAKDANLRQELTFMFRETPPRDTLRTDHVPIRLPMPMKRKVTVVAGGDLASADLDKGLIWVKPSAGISSREPLKIVIEFDEPLPAGDAVDWQVPLAWPEGATQLEAKVRVWSEPGVVAKGLDLKERWQERPVELVEGHNEFPALVLFGTGKTLDLTLAISRNGNGRLPLVVCDKALIQVTVDEGGNHHYRARYLIRKLHGHGLDVLIPTAATPLLVTLDRYKIGWHRDENDVFHLKIDPEIVRAIRAVKPEADGLVLKIEYTLPANFVEGDPRWQTVLAGPVLRGDVFVGQVRWHVSLPSSWVSVVAASGVHPDYHWALQRYVLLAPEAVVPASDLEWPDAGNVSEPPVSQVFSRNNQDGLIIVHLPWLAWLSVCSGLLLTLGLSLFMMPMPRTLFWMIVVALGAGTVVAGFIWPSWVPPLIYGVEIGVLVLAMFLGVQWLMRERYRRQVIFMPGFTRLKAGSSLLQAAARPREASTVDAPASALPGRGSSVSQKPPV